MLRSLIVLIVTGIVLARPGTRGEGSAGRAVRTPLRPSPVVRIPAGTFAMGVSPDDVERIREQCLNEPDVHDENALLACTDVRPARADVLCNELREQAGQDRVWLPAFGIDRTEVTVAAYARCVTAGTCAPPHVARGAPLLGGDDRPVVGVAWDDAVAYCTWVGARLPTEAEWERAARGTDGRPFPWGWQYDPRHANHGGFTNMECIDRDDGFAATAPAGSFPWDASPEGVLDMAGNVMEWVADFYAPNVRAPDEGPRRLVSPTGPDHGQGHVVRGGSYRRPGFEMRATTRSARVPSERALDLGFRCAWDVR